jgi:predicted nucleic acid-binding protein
LELADTSAWSNRHKSAAVRAEFNARLLAGEMATCDQVKAKLLYSARDAQELNDTLEDLDALFWVPIGDAEWRRAFEVMEALAQAGPTHHRQVKIPDLLVAAAGEHAGLTVCHYDRDFDVIAAVTGQPVRAIAPLGSL